MEAGYYKSSKGSKEFQEIWDNSLVRYSFWTKGTARSSDNDFDKHGILFAVYEVIDGIAYWLAADRTYHLPYVGAIKVEHLDVLELEPNGHIPGGWRGRSHIDKAIEIVQKGETRKMPMV